MFGRSLRVEVRHDQNYFSLERFGINQADTTGSLPVYPYLIMCITLACHLFCDAGGTRLGKYSVSHLLKLKRKQDFVGLKLHFLERVFL